MAGPPQPCSSGSSPAKSGHSIFPAGMEGMYGQVSGRGYRPKILERWCLESTMVREEAEACTLWEGWASAGMLTHLSCCRVFGFVARKQGSATDNVCHLFAEHDPEQPASAIVNFVSKVMIGSPKKI